MMNDLGNAFEKSICPGKGDDCHADGLDRPSRRKEQVNIKNSNSVVAYSVRVRRRAFLFFPPNNDDEHSSPPPSIFLVATRAPTLVALKHIHSLPSQNLLLFFRDFFRFENVHIHVRRPLSRRRSLCDRLREFSCI